MSEIRYGRSALPECCRILAGRVAEPYGSSLLKIWEKVHSRSGASFHRIFCEEMESCLAELPLRGEDRQIFLQVFSEQGFQEEKMQLRGMEQGIERLTRLIEEQERDRKEKCRLAVGLGAMGGLLLLIVLL